MSKSKKIFIYILGTAQDGGYPHANCTDKCCRKAWNNNSLHRYPSCIAIIDISRKKYWLLDITPEIKKQIHILEQFGCTLEGVFITHAHIGHYTGLFNLGLEIMNLNNIPIYVMPKMKNFLINNSQTNHLIENDNICLIDLFEDKAININDDLSVTPFDVPHRNELSETVGFKVQSQKKSIIYLPDIDSWYNWDDKLIKLVKLNDVLFLDGTFYNKNEVKQRDISKIPHPEIIATMNILSGLDVKFKNRVHFIHLNHTNNVINLDSEEYEKVIKNGFCISQEQQIFNL